VQRSVPGAPALGAPLAAWHSQPSVATCTGATGPVCAVRLRRGGATLVQACVKAECTQGGQWPAQSLPADCGGGCVYDIEVRCVYGMLINTMLARSYG
jgi:hypothetical protein